jgi:signal transduction histidine kinase/PAS domain-containing protein
MSLGLARNLGIGGLVVLVFCMGLLGFRGIGKLTHALRDTVETYNPTQVDLVRLNERLSRAGDRLDAYLTGEGSAHADVDAALEDLEIHFALLATEARRLGWAASLELGPVSAARGAFGQYMEEVESTGARSDAALELLDSASALLGRARSALAAFSDSAHMARAQPASRALIELCSNSLRSAEAGLDRIRQHMPSPLQELLATFDEALALLDALEERWADHHGLHAEQGQRRMPTRSNRAVAELGDALVRARATLYHFEEQLRYDWVSGIEQHAGYLAEVREVMLERWGAVTLALVSLNHSIGRHGGTMQRLATREGEQLQHEFLWVSACALALALFISVSLNFYHRTRLRPMAEGAQMLAEGHLSYRIGDEVDDEIGELAAHFDRMAERLEAKDNALASRLQELDSANHEVRQANSYLGDMIDSIPDALLVVDEARRITRANQAARALAGCDDDALVGAALTSVLPVDPTAAAEAGERVVGVEGLLLAENGEPVPVALSAAVGEASTGVPGGALIIAKDLRGARLAERRRELKYTVARVLARAEDLPGTMPAVLAAMGSALDFQCGSYWVWNEERKLLLHRGTWGASSPALAEFLGCQQTNDPKKPGGLIRRAWSTGRFAWLEDAGANPALVRAPFARAAGLRGALAFPVTDGTTTYGVLELFSSRRRTPDAELLEDCESIGRQVGEFCRRWHAEAALVEKTRRLEKSNRELDQFAYVTSHDLKAPLRAIGNLADWIEEDLGDDLAGEVRENMALLRGRVNRMEALIQGILDYSRIGREAVKPEQVDLAELVPEVVDSLGIPAGFEVTVEGTLPVLRASRVRLTQVFSNLIGNAIKYHDGNEGRVQLRVSNGGRWYRFSVEDDGPGIPDEYHDRVFGIFQTLEARDTVESTGIGLTLVKKIVEEQGGSISIAPHDGRGAHFQFTWPAEEAA